MIVQPIQVNKIQGYGTYLEPEFYTTTVSSTVTPTFIVLPIAFKPLSTQVYLAGVYQAFTSYLELSDNITLYFINGFPLSGKLQIRYNLLGT